MCARTIFRMGLLKLAPRNHSLPTDRLDVHHDLHLDPRKFLKRTTFQES